MPADGMALAADAAAAGRGAGRGQSAVGGARGGPPVAGYDELSIPQLRGRLRGLSAGAGRGAGRVRAGDPGAAAVPDHAGEPAHHAALQLVANPTSPESPWPVRTVAMKIAEWVARLGEVWVEGQVAQLNRRGSATAFLTLRDPAADVSVR